MFNRKPKPGRQPPPEAARPMTAEETIRATIEQKVADALKQLDAVVADRKADVQKWAGEYLAGLKVLNDLSLIRNVLDKGGTVRQVVVDREGQQWLSYNPCLTWNDRRQTRIEIPELRDAKAIRFIIIAEPVDVPAEKK